MSLASPFRRRAGLLVAATVGLSTAVLTATGTAQAATPSWTSTASGVQAPIPAGICAVEWSVHGGSGGTDSENAGGDAGGALHVLLPARAGEVYTLFPGTAGAAGMPATSGAPGGTNGDGVSSDQGAPGGLDSDTGIGAGGGGAASVVTVGGVPIAIAYGGVGGGVGGGGGGYGDTNWAGGGAIADQDYDPGYTDGASGDGAIHGEGIPCKPAMPNFGYAKGLDGALELQFMESIGGDVPATGYEYSIDGGDWTALTVVVNESGLVRGVVRGLTNGTEYAVRVRAVGGANTAPSDDGGEVRGTPYKRATTPGNAKVVAADGKLTVSWDPSTAGTFPITGYLVGRQWTNPDGQSGGRATFCETAATVFTCTAPAQPGVKYELYVLAVDAADNVSEEAGVTSDIVPASAAVPESDGDMASPAGSAPSVATGKTITLSGSGYMPHSTVTLVIYSTPQVLTTVLTDANGDFTATVTVPAGLAAGQHTLVAAGLDPDGVMRYMTLPVTVTDAGTATVSAPELARTGADVTAPAIGGLAAVLVGAGLLVVARRRPETVAAAPGADLAD